MNKIKMYYNNQINKMGKKQKIAFYASSVILILLVLLFWVGFYTLGVEIILFFDFDGLIIYC